MKLELWQEAFILGIVCGFGLGVATWMLLIMIG